MTQTDAFRCGYVAIVGAPNVGKSTLMNGLLGQKISIVTRKAQTTRQRVLGILSDEQRQIVFLDTPGLVEPKYLLHQRMIGSASAALADADVVLLLTEVSRGAELPAEVESRVLARHQEKAILLVINKVDLVDRLQVLPMIEAFAGRGLFREIVPISALKKDNLLDLVHTITNYLPVHPPLYPADIVSEHPERFFVAELIREQVFNRFREEVPYSAAVQIVDFKEREQGKIYINAEIAVERPQQKAIVIGKKGEALKALGIAARREIELFLGKPAYIELRVVVREKWREKEEMLKRFGYSGD